MRLVNHPFRLDSQRLLSYLTSMRVLTLAVTPAISTTFWNTIYFYTASATGEYEYVSYSIRQLVAELIKFTHDPAH